MRCVLTTFSKDNDDDDDDDDDDDSMSGQISEDQFEQDTGRYGEVIRFSHGTKAKNTNVILIGNVVIHQLLQSQP